MLADKLLGLCLCVRDDSIRLGLCVRKDRVLIGNDLLIPLDLIRSLQSELSQQLLEFLLIDDDLCCRQRLKFAAVNIFFYFFDNLLDSAGHDSLNLLLQMNLLPVFTGILLAKLFADTGRYKS